MCGAGSCRDCTHSTHQTTLRLIPPCNWELSVSQGSSLGVEGTSEARLPQVIAFFLSLYCSETATLPGKWPLKFGVPLHRMGSISTAWSLRLCLWEFDSGLRWRSGFWIFRAGGSQMTYVQSSPLKSRYRDGMVCKRDLLGKCLWRIKGRSPDRG